MTFHEYDPSFCQRQNGHYRALISLLGRVDLLVLYTGILYYVPRQLTHDKRSYPPSEVDPIAYNSLLARHSSDLRR